MVRDPCPVDPEDAAERYALERMSSAEATVFDRHIRVCRRCAAVVAKEIRLARLMKAASRGCRYRLTHGSV